MIKCWVLALILVITAGGHQSMAQFKKHPRVGTGKPLPKFKRNRKTAIICPIFIASKYPYQGIGFKIGDPFAITYKLYLTPKFAVSLDGGSAASGLYREFHEENFSNLGIADTTSYEAHKINQEIVVQARIVFHQEIFARSIQGLDIIGGLGWQVRDIDIRYEFFTKDQFGIRESNSISVNDFTMGPELMIGVEYAYFVIPVSAFAEVNFFQNLNVPNAKIRLQGGMGLRYVF